MLDSEARYVQVSVLIYYSCYAGWNKILSLILLRKQIGMSHGVTKDFLMVLTRRVSHSCPAVTRCDCGSCCGGGGTLFSASSPE